MSWIAIYVSASSHVLTHAYTIHQDHLNCHGNLVAQLFQEDVLINTKLLSFFFGVEVHCMIC